MELRPTCEHCSKALPPDSLEVRICTYECTFCATCVAADAKTVQLNLKVLSGFLENEDKDGAPGGIRTPNLLIRSQALCPVGLRARKSNAS